MLKQVTDYLLKKQITHVSHIDTDITIKLGENRLWVTTSWRLEKEATIVIGNDNLVELLYHEDYKEEYQSSLDFIKNCLCNTTIVEVKYSDWNELILKLSNGYTFRTFQSYGDDAENFQLYIPQQRFLVYTNKVDLEDLGQFNKR